VVVVEDSEALVEVYSRLAESFERFWVDIYLFVKFERESVCVCVCLCKDLRSLLQVQQH
jgi:hypothetical protein